MLKVSTELVNLLNYQWVHERENASVYIFIGAWLKNKGFDKLGKFFIDASKEEEEHANLVLNLMTDLNLYVEVPPIPSGNFSISSISSIAQKFVEREELTTESLMELKEMSSEHGVIEEFARNMISKQQHELSECYSFRDKCEIIGDDWKMVFLWDASL